MVVVAFEVLGEQVSGGGLEELAYPSLVMLALISSFGSDQQGGWTVLCCTSSITHCRETLPMCPPCPSIQFREDLGA